MVIYIPFEGSDIPLENMIASRDLCPADKDAGSVSKFVVPQRPNNPDPTILNLHMHLIVIK